MTRAYIVGDANILLLNGLSLAIGGGAPLEESNLLSKHNSRVFSQLVVVGFLLCLCSALGGFVTVEGQTPVWSDDFNDGNYDGWTVQEGSYSATNNQLEGGSAVWNWIYRASTVAYGEWRFDVCCETVAGVRVAFMALDTSGVGYQRPNDGYYLQFVPYENYIRLYRNVGGTQSWMDGDTVTGLMNTLLQVIVTRNSTGYFNVTINGVDRLQAQSTHHTSSAYFLILMTEGGYIDNIEVYSQISDGDGNGNGEGATPIPIEVIAIAGGLVAVIVIIVVVVFVLRRRKSGP